jgi:hypothetical protein
LLLSFEVMGRSEKGSSAPFMDNNDSTQMRAAQDEMYGWDKTQLLKEVVRLREVNGILKAASQTSKTDVGDF